LVARGRSGPAGPKLIKLIQEGLARHSRKLFKGPLVRKIRVGPPAVYADRRISDNEAEILAKSVRANLPQEEWLGVSQAGALPRPFINARPLEATGTRGSGFALRIPDLLFEKILSNPKTGMTMDMSIAHSVVSHILSELPKAEGGSMFYGLGRWWKTLRPREREQLELAIALNLSSSNLLFVYGWKPAKARSRQPWEIRIHEDKEGTIPKNMKYPFVAKHGRWMRKVPKDFYLELEGDVPEDEQEEREAAKKSVEEYKQISSFPDKTRKEVLATMLLGHFVRMKFNAMVRELVSDPPTAFSKN
jgi:hypothetical protein